MVKHLSPDVILAELVRALQEGVHGPGLLGGRSVIRLGVRGGLAPGLALLGVCLLDVWEPMISL
eukprot:6985780-Alexandrium_andersonii.AAC.1